MRFHAYSLGTLPALVDPYRPAPQGKTPPARWRSARNVRFVEPGQDGLDARGLSNYLY